MLIDKDLLRFCARKTSKVVSDYNRYCVLPAEGDGFPRSVDDLEVLIREEYGKPINNRVLRVDPSKAKYRSFYIPYPDRCEIYYVPGINRPAMRYYKAKELFQIHLWQESLVTTDVVDLVQNMILRASPESIELDLGHAATSETLADIAAMEFLFPYAKRIEFLQARGGNKDGIAELADHYEIPAFIVQRGLNVVQSMGEFFGGA